MTQIVENIRWILKDIEEWVHGERSHLDSNIEIVQKLYEVDDGGDEDELYEVVGNLGVERSRNFSEMEEELIEVTGNLQKYKNHCKLLESYLITREENLRTLNGMQARGLLNKVVTDQRIPKPKVEEKTEAKKIMLK